MLKTILSLEGVKKLNSNDLKMIMGGNLSASGMCNYDTSCSHGCSETYEGVKKCSICCIADGLESA